MKTILYRSIRHALMNPRVNYGVAIFNHWIASEVMA